MPELPDITVYVEALQARILGSRLESIRFANPFLLRSVTPARDVFEGNTVHSIGRLGKRIVIGFNRELYMVIHLMIAGRLHWKPGGARIPGKIGLAAFDFSTGTMTLTEAGVQKRASLHLVEGTAHLQAMDPGGLDILGGTREDFTRQLQKENHTIKRTLTDPRLLSGIGNAYSDEILHRAKISPLRLTSQLSETEIAALFDSCREVLLEWTHRLRKEAGDDFPERVTAFRQEMSVHGKYNQPCPVCSTPVQRIVYAQNECNYCPRCQTEGRLLADRAFSRLLKSDWPKTIDELEQARNRHPGVKRTP